MGCGMSVEVTRRSSKVTVNEDAHRDYDEDMYLSLKKRYGLPNTHKRDGFEFGLCTKDNVGGMYSMYVGTSRTTNDRVCIKQFNVQHMDPSYIVQEAANLARMTHTGFPRLLELFHTDTSVYMVTTYTDVFRLKTSVDLRNRSTAYKVPEVRTIFQSLVASVSSAHEQGVVLRSLLPEHIMVARYAPEQMPRGVKAQGITSCMEVTICDMSMAQHISKADSGACYQDHPLFEWSHLPYMAPELVTKQQCSSACDVWALGVLLYMMLCARLPFTVEDPMDRALLLQRIRDAEYTFHEDDAVWKQYPDAQNLLRGIFVSEPSQRMTLRDIRRHPWMTSTK